MRVSVASDGWVACDNAVTQLRVCNNGNQSASNPRVVVTIPSEFAFVSSVPAPSGVSGKTLTYFMGAFAAGDCKNIALTLAVPCNVGIGEAFCVEANAFPDFCFDPQPGWDGTNLVVNAYCNAPDSVRFSVLKTTPGPMTSSPSFVITEDHLMRASGLLPLIIGDSITFTLDNPTGGTYTFQTSQTPGHPFPEPISVSIEGCGSNPGSTGFLLQYPQHSGNPHGDIFCDAVQESIGGQEKMAFPIGFGTEHLILKKSVLDYRISFQNTTNAIVQTVTLVDTLSSSLNWNSLRIGTSSHPFTFSIQNGVLTVVFSNLQLPPASVNPTASRGFFSFHIGVANDAPLGTLIENTAKVILDNQIPSITGTTFHRLGENFIVVNVVDNQANIDFQLQVSPNPMETSALFSFSGEGASGLIVLQIMDMTGSVVRVFKTTEGSLVFEKNELKSGVYFFYCIGQNGSRIGGRLVVL